MLNTGKVMGLQRWEVSNTQNSYPDIENIIWIDPLLRCHLFYKATFSLCQRWPPNKGLNVVA